MDETNPNYYNFLQILKNANDTLSFTYPWIEANRDRGEKIPPYCLAERKGVIDQRNSELLQLDPNFDFSTLQTRTRVLLGVKFTATSNGKPTLEELVNAENIFSAAVGKTPISIPDFDPETGFLDLNLAAGNVLTLTITSKSYL